MPGPVKRLSAAFSKEEKQRGISLEAAVLGRSIEREDVS